MHTAPAPAHAPAPADAPPAPPAPRPAAVVDAVRFLDAVFPPPRRFDVRLWDGTVLPAATPATVTLALRTPGALRRMFRLPLERALGEAYLAGDFDLEGEIRAIGPAFAAARGAALSVPTVLALLRSRARLPRAGRRADVRGAGIGAAKRSREWDRAGIRYHYDVGNDFYRLFLDRRMVYSCAYFPTGTESLDEAQDAKLELICRKLRLAPGMRMLDIGCGWGALAIHAASRHGARVVGVTLSEEQATLARQRAAQAGVGDRIEVRLLDYRDVEDGPFDRVASVGMFEHVGPDRLAEYFAAVYRLLRPGGLFLNHGISAPPRTAKGRVRRALDRLLLDNAHFRRTYVFPNGGLVPVSRANLQAEQAGLEVRDVEDLREHYARTLAFWAERIEAERDEAVRLAGERVFRIWRLFTGVASWQFASGELSLHQSLLERRGDVPTELPWSRADLYA